MNLRRPWPLPYIQPFSYSYKYLQANTLELVECMYLSENASVHPKTIQWLCL